VLQVEHIAAVPEELDRKRVAEAVRMDVIHISSLAQFDQQMPDIDAVHRMVVFGEEEQVVLVEIALSRIAEDGISSPLFGESTFLMFYLYCYKPIIMLGGQHTL